METPLRDALQSASPARLVSADPPWPFEDNLPGAGRGAAKHYLCGELEGRPNGLTIDELCAFPLPPIAASAALFLWRVASQVEEAYKVARAWGFVPKSEIVWEKYRRCGPCKGTGKSRKKKEIGLICARCAGLGARPHFGMGRSVRHSHEIAIIATRGRPEVLRHDVLSRFSALVPTGEKNQVIHSAKPAKFYRIAEGLFPGPRVELFARYRRPGWDCYGNELPEAPVEEEMLDGR